MTDNLKGSALGFEYDHDAYEPILGRDHAGKRVVIGVNRRPQDVIDSLRAERAVESRSAPASARVGMTAHGIKTRTVG